MKLQITLLVWILQFKFHFGCDSVKSYQNKRLLATATTVLSTRNMTSEEQCLMSCYYDNLNCLAVNIITTGDVITCEMTTGLGSDTDMVDDSTSVLYVKDYNKCVEDPGFCLNGGTCQPTWTTARCHCIDRFQGDRCQSCKPNFQGDRCDRCLKRFQGDECDTCVSGYYGDACGYRFILHQNTECLTGQDLGIMPSVSPGFEDCKHRCANNTDCGGFIVLNGKCFFKGLSCDSDVFYNSGSLLFLKKLV